LHQLLRLISLRYLRVAWGRSLLTLFGITLGVAVVFAIDVVNTSVMHSFRGAIDKVAGKTALTVGAGTGIDEEWLETVRAVPGVAAVAPMIEQSTWDDKTKTQLMVLGVDTVTDSQVRDYEVHTNDVQVADELAFLNNPHAVIVTTRFAERVGVKIGDTLHLDTVDGKADFTILGTLAARGPATVFGGDLLLMDVYASQIAFGRGKRFDHLDVVPEEGVAVDALKSRIEHALAGKATVTRPQRRSQEAERLMAGFSLGLSLIGLVAIFVGGFVVYNALAIAVVQRRHEIGVWRALGATRMHMMCVFLGEGLIMGLLGAIAGLGFGMLLARAVVQVVSGAITSLYVHLQLDELSVSTRDVVAALAVGVVSSGIAAYLPARRAAFVEPSSVMRKQNGGESAAFASGRTSLRMACAALLVAAIAAWFAHVRHDFLLGYTVSGICALAVGFFAPSLGALVGKAARRLTRGAAPDIVLGVVSFMRNVGRNSVAIAAFGIGLANVVNTDTFVGSMKYSTTRWFERAARADLIVFVGQKVQANIEHPLPESVGRELAQYPGVAFVDPFRMTNQSLDGRPFKLAAHELERYREFNELPVVQGDVERAMPKISAGTGLAASEAFVHDFGLHVGDQVTLQTGSGPRSFEIALIYLDYSSDLGILMTTRSVYTRLWNDTLVDTYSLYLKPGVNGDDVRGRISTDLSSRHGLLVLSNEQYRAGFLEFIDASFALMRGTEIVAIIVAVLGIITTLLVSVMDRRTEIGMLKAIGADAKQIQRMLITEAALIGLASSIIGVCFGAVFSAYIVRELLRFQVGWVMSWRMSGWVIVEAIALGQFVTILAAWWPVRSARRVAPAEALQYE
jgi:putative ABC transport system permease protein